MPDTLFGPDETVSPQTLLSQRIVTLEAQCAAPQTCGARIAIVDITGVPFIDSEIANAFI